MKRPTPNTLQNLIYAIIWTVVFALPVAVYYHSGDEGGVSWRWVMMFWTRVAPYFVLFLINNSLLVPRLMLRGYFGMYTVAVVVVIAVLFEVIQPQIAHHFMPPVGAPPMPPQAERPPGRIPIMLIEGFTAIMMVGFNVAIRYLFKSIRDERRIRELEALRLQSELNYLKAQINPHFFMNTLNNIHALVDIDSERAKESVIELSKIMRYVLYEAEGPTIDLRREIVFIENYVSLQRIRFSDEIDIHMEFPDPVPEVRVPPMLLVTLVENAFKHGISYRRDSFIHTRLTVAGDANSGERLTFCVENSISESIGGRPGVGMENMRKRLELMFGSEDYSLTAHRTMEKYSVTLEIPLIIT
jgi:hypothetical protein